MKKTVLFPLIYVLLLCCPRGYAQPTNDWQQRADFTIEVSLDTNDHSLTGWETIRYTNNAPDTLYFIWFHIWANAFKNDRTAFSEALLREDRTDFYFSGREQKGYINQLDFKVDGTTALTENHASFIDVLKLVLPQPLAPGHTIRITTPFHIRLPYNFLDNGYKQGQYCIAQWFPKPAVYNRTGWHVMPYTGQKETHTETGDYEVHIKVPAGYKVIPREAGEGATETTVAGNGSNRLYSCTRKNGTDFIWQAESPAALAGDTAYDHAKAAQAKSTAWLNNKLSKIQSLIIDTGRRANISLLPLAGYNMYDGLMAGGMVHNYLAAQSRLRFLAIPLYGFKSKGLNGLGRLSYSFPESDRVDVRAGLAFSRFSMNNTPPMAVPQSSMHFTKLVPFVRLSLKNKGISGKLNRFIELKHFYITEENPRYKEVSSGAETILTADLYTTHTSITRLTMGVQNSRKLYPYSGFLNLEKHSHFIKAGFTGHYYFNFANNVNGLNVRLFAGKLFYASSVSSIQRFMDSRYHLNLTGPGGEEDYTYSNYFIGRNKFEGWASQQIMMRDGGFKVSTDLLSDKVGKTDDWLSAVNFSTWIPDKINPLKVLPVKIPLKLFADIGTFAETWSREAEDRQTDRFLFDAGLQLSLFRETVNIYFPLIYSKVFKDYFRSSLGDNRFWKTVSFSIDIQHLDLKKLTGLTGL